VLAIKGVAVEMHLTGVERDASGTIAFAANSSLLDVTVSAGERRASSISRKDLKQVGGSVVAKSFEECIFISQRCTACEILSGPSPLIRIAPVDTTSVRSPHRSNIIGGNVL
jgi:hypothetical protein